MTMALKTTRFDIQDHLKTPEEQAAYIEAAQRAAKAENIGGKAVTPYLLSKILELSDGKSLATNIVLVENNARLAARIAKAL